LGDSSAAVDDGLELAVKTPPADAFELQVRNTLQSLMAVRPLCAAQPPDGTSDPAVVDDPLPSFACSNSKPQKRSRRLLAAHEPENSLDEQADRTHDDECNQHREGAWSARRSWWFCWGNRHLTCAA
jgi:hypothetical protein